MARIEAMEIEMTVSAPFLTALQARMDAAEQRLAELEGALANTAAELRKRISALEAVGIALDAVGGVESRRRRFESQERGEYGV